MNTKAEAYLDANFLIYWCFPKTPEIKKRVRFLLAKILRNYELFTSLLSFDETWWGVKKAYNAKFKTSLACFEEPIYSKLGDFTAKILLKVKVIQFLDSQEGIISALQNIKEYELHPRDAFHLALMENNRLATIVTDDPKFVNQQIKMRIKVVTP